MDTSNGIAISSTSISIKLLYLSPNCVPAHMQATGNAQYIGDLSLLYSVDWMLGMLRTCVNVWGDACACCTIDTLAKNYAKNEVAVLEVSKDIANSHPLELRA